MKRLIACAILLALVPAPVGAQQPTIQQQFDAASTSLEAGDWAEALRQYQAIEPRLRAGSRSHAVTQVRMASALTELGRLDEAGTLLRASLPLLPDTDASLAGDRFSGLLTLGRIAEASLDYSEASRQYRAAAAVPIPDIEKLAAYRGLIQTQLFDDPQGAVRDADRALQLIGAEPGRDRELEGRFHTLRGRALLNLGRHAEARDALETALRLLGNLTLRVTYADLLARSDLALAALLVRDSESARRYLAYTGAGRFGRGSIEPGPGNAVPNCGEAGLSPDDVAVIEFSVLSDGTVAHVVPIYSALRGPGALAFARAVSGWTFETEGLRDIPPLMRAASRVEIRCSQGLQGDGAAYYSSFGRWRPLMELVEGVAMRPPNSLTGLRRDLQLAEQAAPANPVALVAGLWSVAQHPGIPRPERAQILRRALALAVRERAPAQFLGDAARQIVQLESRPNFTSGDLDYRAMIGLVGQDRLAIANVELMQARSLFQEREKERALEIATRLRDLDEVDDDPDTRRRVLELMTAIHASRGEVAEARAAYETVGANFQPCALPRRLRRLSASSEDFPDEAMQWGFEGWASNQMMVSPEGRVENVRTLIAYPPFVFGEAAREVASTIRFEPSFVPDRRSCPINTGRIRFQLSP